MVNIDHLGMTDDKRIVQPIKVTFDLIILVYIMQQSKLLYYIFVLY